MKGRKILFYINAINGGGAERVMVNLSSCFAHHGYEAVLVTSYCDTWEYPLDQEVKRISLEHTEIVQCRFKRNLTRILKLRLVCRKEKPDIVISFMAEPNYRAIIAALFLKVKNIISVRNDPDIEYRGFVGKLLKKYLLPLAGGCVFQTEDAKRAFPMRLQRKSTIIFNAVKEDFYIVDRAPVEGRVISCGRLEAQKNHKLLIRSFMLIVGKHPEAQLLIYGEGSLRGELEEFITGEGLDSKVKLMGSIEDIPGALRNAEIFVLSSDYEGMPNALMEALATGLPCISTDCPCGGPRALIRDGVNGVLVPTKDEKRMAEAMDNLLSCKDYADALGKKARMSAYEYEPEKTFEKWKEFAEKVVSCKPYRKC